MALIHVCISDLAGDTWILWSLLLSLLIYPLSFSLKVFGAYYHKRSCLHLLTVTHTYQEEGETGAKLLP